MKPGDLLVCESVTHVWDTLRDRNVVCVAKPGDRALVLAVKRQYNTMLGNWVLLLVNGRVGWDAERAYTPLNWYSST